MAAAFRVNGVPETSHEPSLLARTASITVTVKAAALVGRARAGAAPVVLDGDADDVVEIELEDGLRLWTTVADAQRDFGGERSRAATDGPTDLPGALTIGPASRGAIGGWALKAVRILGLGDVEGTMADFAATHVESRLSPGPGLYRCTLADAAQLTAVRAIESGGPVLIFLHGTASSTTGSFGGLWTSQGGVHARAIFAQYGNRVLAWQHRTLSQSPIENALELVTELERLLPAGSELHLVSHSRGGMIGELLARAQSRGAAPFTPDDIALFAGDARSRDREALSALSAALQRTAFRVTRFVRVACPARGTTLADERLDRYLSLLINLAGLAGLAGNPVFEGLTTLLAGVLKKRADPHTMPGIEAMMPSSPLVRLLNDPNRETTADLHVLGGDLAGSGVFGRLKALATDFYYRDDHDVVVNTVAMFGGTRRTGGVRYWIDTGDQVTHFHYFSCSDTARRLVAALKGIDADFRQLNDPPSAVTSASYIKRGGITRPVVVVLPGIMGSQLSVGTSPIWMHLRTLALRGLDDLTLDAADVTATGLLGDGYDALCRHLDQTHDVRPFPYDWRLPLEQAADALTSTLTAICEAAEKTRQPVRLLAHSMGGLVVRAMLATEAGAALWRRITAHDGGRFVMLGTPNRGSHAIAAMLMGRDALVRKLALVALTRSQADLLAVVAAYPGVLNLLPYAGAGASRTPGSVADYFAPASWARLIDADAPDMRGLFGGSVDTDKSAGFRWSIPSAAALERARRMADVIASQSLDPARVVYVAGLAPETACDVVIDTQAREGRRVRVMATRRGDGRVTWETGIPTGVPTYYMDTVHGDLANDDRHFSAIVDLLETGRTTRLSVSPPVSRAAEAAPFEARDQMPDVLPDETDLAVEALGGTQRHRVATADGRPSPVSIRVVHDNLSNSEHPVVVSHYSQDVIVAAEKYLDGELGGRLSELLRMELYPGPINTAVVVVNDRSAGETTLHPGAIVVGLGEVGSLTPGALTSTLAHALTLYGADAVGKERRRMQRRRDESTGETVTASVAAILIGSGEGGVSVLDSMRALLRAVQQANRRLRPSDEFRTSTLTARIDQVDVFELYEDRAIEAMYALRSLTSSPEFADFNAERLLVRGADGRRRARYGAEAGWWQRLRIERRKNGSLAFEAVTRLARNTATLLPTQRGLVDGFIARAVGSTAANPRLGQTLFELLVPNDLKSFAPDRQKLALMLDEKAAELPWELMQDGFDRQPEPLAVASGMVRQLLVHRERQQVLRATEDTALVVGNPKVTDPRFPSLPGARDEAEAVAAVLQAVGRYDVDLLLEDVATPTTFLTALHERPLRVLHLAAHGVFEFEHTPGERVSGLVLGDGTYFTASEANQLRYVPELVFINCCFLGKTTGDARPRARYDRLAANLATQFIRMGARAVIAAGWEVDDGAAKTFATTFYDGMLRGMLFGDAVHQARRTTYRLHGDTNTWGAYQCYGDVSFALGMGMGQSNPTEFVSDAEFRLWLENVAAGAKASDGLSDAMVEELKARIAQAPEEWFAAADMNALAGAAFLGAARFDEALGFFEALKRAEVASAPMLAMEQLASCYAQRASELAADAKGTDEARARLDDAERLVEALEAIGKTTGRSALLGDVRRRRVMLARTRPEQRKALSAMADAFRDAYGSSSEGRAGDPAHLVDLITAEIGKAWLAAAPSVAAARRPPRASAASVATGVVAGLLDELASRSQGSGRGRSAGSLLLRAEHALLTAMHAGSMDTAERAAVVDAFARALPRGGTHAQRASIQSVVRLLQVLLAARGAAGKDLAASLSALESAVLHASPEPSA